MRLWQQVKLQGLDRAVADQRKTASACGAAGDAEHALPLCNALRRLLLKRMPGADLELRAQVGAMPVWNNACMSLVACHCHGRQEGFRLMCYEIGKTLCMLYML